MTSIPLATRPIVSAFRTREKTEQEVFNNLVLTVVEKAEVNDLIISQLEQGVLQFSIIQYTCSRTKKPLAIESPDSLRNAYSHIERTHDAVTRIRRKDLVSCLKPCKSGNKVLAMFLRIYAHLKFMGHPFYITKEAVKVTYRQTSLFPWYLGFMQPAAESEYVTELNLVYDMSETFASLVLTKYKTLATVATAQEKQSVLVLKPETRKQEEDSSSVSDSLLVDD